MAWNQTRPSAGHLLTRIKDWETRGLAYWQARVVTCNERIRSADSSGQLGRAIEGREIAQEAVRRLSAEG